MTTADESLWLTVPDVAERLGTTASRVRRMLEERELLGVREGGVLRIPAVFLADDGPRSDLRGTAILLEDSGFSGDEAVEWLLTVEPSLGVAPIAALAAGRKAEVRRVAQALA